jgi:hypothetical protein
MELAFPWPVSTGEWLAWLSAAATLLLGLYALVMPRAALRLVRLRTQEGHPEAVAEVRGGIGGFYVGMGLACLLLAQPWLYIALGFAWACTALGRLLSILVDRGGNGYNWGFLVFDVVLAALPLAFALGYVA